MATVLFWASACLIVFLVGRWVYRFVRPSSGAAALVGVGAAAVCVALYFTFSDGYVPAVSKAESFAATEDFLRKIRELKRHLADEPGSVEGWAALAGSYKLLGYHAEASAAYAALAELSVLPLATQLDRVESLFFSNQGNFIPEAVAILNELSVQHPHSTRVLWLSGALAFQHGDYGKAESLWTELLENPALEDAAAGALREQLAHARLLAAGDRAHPDPDRSRDKSSSHLQVDVVMDERLAWDGEGRLFVYARPQQGAAMPLAIKSFERYAFPFVVELTGQDYMLPSSTLDDHPSFDVVARISKSGDAQMRPGDLWGMTAFSKNENVRNDTVEVIIDRKVPSPPSGVEGNAAE